MFNIDEKEFQVMNRKITKRVEDEVVSDLMSFYKQGCVKDDLIRQVRNKLIIEIKKDLQESVLNDSKLKEVIEQSQSLTESYIKEKIHNSIQKKVDNLFGKIN